MSERASERAMMMLASVSQSERKGEREAVCIPQVAAGALSQWCAVAARRGEDTLSCTQLVLSLRPLTTTISSSTSTLPGCRVWGKVQRKTLSEGKEDIDCWAECSSDSASALECPGSVVVVVVIVDTGHVHSSLTSSFLTPRRQISLSGHSLSRHDVVCSAAVVCLASRVHISGTSLASRVPQQQLGLR